MDCKTAFELTVQNKMRPAFGQRVRELFNADFDCTAAVAILHGKPAPAPIIPNDDPSAIFPALDNDELEAI
jgi:hypothetical protein